MSFLLQFDKFVDARSIFYKILQKKQTQKICQITACNVLKLMVMTIPEKNLKTY